MDEDIQLVQVHSLKYVFYSLGILILYLLIVYLLIFSFVDYLLISYLYIPIISIVFGFFYKSLLNKYYSSFEFLYKSSIIASFNTTPIILFPIMLANRLHEATKEIAATSSNVDVANFISEFDINYWIFLPLVIICFNLPHIITLIKYKQIKKLSKLLIPIFICYIFIFIIDLFLDTIFGSIV